PGCSWRSSPSSGPDRVEQVRDRSTGGGPDQADQVAVGVPDAGDEAATPHVLRVLDGLAASIEELLEGRRDILDIPVGSGAFGVPVGVESDLQVPDLVADVVRGL